MEGRCVCKAGWTGNNCSTVDEKVFTCLPDCSGHGHYDLHTSACVCDTYWTGPECGEGQCWYFVGKYVHTDLYSHTLMYSYTH